MRRPDRRRVMRAGLRVALVLIPGLLFGLLAGWVFHFLEVHVHTWYCVALAILLLTMLQLGKTALDDLEVSADLRHGGAAVPVEQPAAVSTIERRLSASVRERRLFVSGLQPMLVALVRDRLALHHDLDLHDARNLLGDELWHWLTTRDYDGTPPTELEVTRMIAAIESV